MMMLKSRGLKIQKHGRGFNREDGELKEDMWSRRIDGIFIN